MPLTTATANLLAQQIYTALQGIATDNVGGIQYMQQFCQLLYEALKRDIQIDTAIPVNTTGGPSAQSGVVTGSTNAGTITVS